MILSEKGLFLSSAFRGTDLMAASPITPLEAMADLSDDLELENAEERRRRRQEFGHCWLRGGG